MHHQSSANSVAPSKRARPREAGPGHPSKRPAPAVSAAALQLDTDAAAAVHAQQGTLKPDLDRHSIEIQAFFPEISAAVLAVRLLMQSLSALFSLTHKCGSLHPVKIPEADFGKLPWEVDPSDRDVCELRLREHLTAVLDCAAKIQPLAVKAGASSTRCFEAYKLMTQTKFADAWTLLQLQSREASDARAVAMLEVHEPLTSWFDKIQAALIACEQTQAMTREGVLLGPVDPRVAAHIAATKRGASSRPERAGAHAGARSRPPAGGGRADNHGTRPAGSPSYGKHTASGDSKPGATKRKRKRPSATSGATATGAATGAASG